MVIIITIEQRFWQTWITIILVAQGSLLYTLRKSMWEKNQRGGGVTALLIALPYFFPCLLHF